MRLVCKNCGNFKTPRIIRIRPKGVWQKVIRHRCKHCLNIAQKAYQARKREEKLNQVTASGFNVGALQDAQNSIKRMLAKLIKPGPYVSLVDVKKANKLLQIQKDLARVAAMV